MEKRKQERNSKGQFIKGKVTVGVQFEEGNQAASKYKDEYCEQMLEFFTRGYDDYYPTFQRFACNIGIDMDTLKNWCDTYPRFRNAYNTAKQKQYDMLAVNTLRGTYNANYAKFEAQNNFGMREKQEVQTTVSGSVDIGIDDKTLALIERVGKRLNGDEKDGK